MAIQLYVMRSQLLSKRVAGVVYVPGATRGFSSKYSFS